MPHLLPRLALATTLLALTTLAHAADGRWCPALPNVGNKLAASLASEVNTHRDDQPRAQPRLHTEGTLPHQGIYDQSVAAKQDFPRMRNLALYVRLHAEDGAALDQLEKLLRAWANLYQPSFNPIDETDFDAYIDAWAISRERFGMDTQSVLDNFFRNMAQGYIAQMRANGGKGTWINNWQSHRIKLVTLTAVLLDDPAMLAEAKRLFRQQLQQNLHDDGSVLDYYERDALHYVTYDLEPLLRAALAARTRGEDWLRLPTAQGATLASALDWLLPYTRGDIVHQEYLRTTVKFDLERRDAKLPGFTGAWDPHSARNLYWLAALLDPRYASIAASLGSPPPWQVACWMS
ncbi:Alginate lyase [Andreprevotia lacus DSM 23236]|jgi:hypothetical protein|uniref:Alginate lyase n=1 Tax=Andreprevotia lacus DSM 23236 TaxID=1121001 RepID=A0A1W1X906_9NEIS|nr:alginate lyase family protein [Andreprevotia lacus]SMC20320.1 Alginate lyase [Andreprevotia lacus DSM 23236]